MHINVVRNMTAGMWRSSLPQVETEQNTVFYQPWYISFNIFHLFRYPTRQKNGLLAVSRVGKLKLILRLLEKLAPRLMWTPQIAISLNSSHIFFAIVFRYLFWTEWGDSPKIEMSDLLGNNRKVIVNTELDRPTGIAVDYGNDRYRSQYTWNSLWYCFNPYMEIHVYWEVSST